MNRKEDALRKLMVQAAAQDLLKAARNLLDNCRDASGELPNLEENESMPVALLHDDLRELEKAVLKAEGKVK